MEISLEIMWIFDTKTVGGIGLLHGIGLSNYTIL